MCVQGGSTISASASDNVSVTGVQFRIDGVAVGAENTQAPYSVTWNLVLSRMVLTR